MSFKISKAALAKAKAKAKEQAEARMKTVMTRGQRMAGGDGFDVAKGIEFDGRKDLMLSKMIALDLRAKGLISGIREDCSLEKRYLQTVSKALAAGDGASGGFLIPPEIGMDLIERLHDTAVVRGMPGVRTRPLADGQELTSARHANGPTVTYEDENETIAEDTTIDFDEVTGRTHKGTCLIKESREFFALAGSEIEDYVRGEVAKAFGEDEDKQILEGVGGKKPLGLYFHPGVLNTTLNATPTYDDFIDAETQVMLQKGRLTGYVFSPYVQQSLRQLKDASGQYIFKTANTIGASGVPQSFTSLNGLPVGITNQIATTGFSGTNEQYIVGGQWDQLVLLQSPNGIRFEMTTEGGDAFANDQVWMKFVRNIGYYLRHPELFVVIGDVQR
jgi:HK97 family phage major capsid protein